MRHTAIIFLAFVLCTEALPSCLVEKHIVGKGAQKNEQIVSQSWYLFWGLLPVQLANAKDMAGTSNDYTIKWFTSVADVGVNLLTFVVTLVRRTVIVTK